jgi:hypothetical protein
MKGQDMKPTTNKPLDTPGGSLAGAASGYDNPAFEIHTGQDSDGGMVRNSDGTRAWGPWPTTACD